MQHSSMNTGILVTTFAGLVLGPLLMLSISESTAAERTIVPTPGSTEKNPLYIRSVEDHQPSAHVLARELKTDLHEASDLDAQIRSANAAQRQVEIGERQVFLGWSALLISVLGTSAVLYSIVLTRRSVRETSKSSDLAVAAADAYRTAERAWLGFLKIDHTRGDFNINGKQFKGYILWVDWINTGRTPALRTNIYSVIKTFDAEAADPIEADFAYEESSASLSGTIPPNVPVNGNQLLMPDSTFKALAEKRCRIFIFGSATYFDAFPGSDSRRTDTCVEVSVMGMVTDAVGRVLGPKFIFTTVGPNNFAT